MKKIIKLASLTLLGTLAGCFKSYEDPKDFIDHYFVDYVMDKYEDEFEKFGPLELEILNTQVEATVNPDVDIIKAIIKIEPEDGSRLYHEASYSSKAWIDTPYNISSYKNPQIKDYINKVKNQYPNGMERYKLPVMITVSTGRRKNSRGIYEPIKYKTGFRNRNEIWINNNLDQYFSLTNKYYMSKSALKKISNHYEIHDPEYAVAMTNYNLRVKRINKKLEEISSAISVMRDLENEWRKNDFINTMVADSVNSFKRSKRDYENKAYDLKRYTASIISRKETDIKRKISTINKLKKDYEDFKAGTKKVTTRSTRPIVKKLPNGREQVLYVTVNYNEYPLWIADLEKDLKEAKEDLRKTKVQHNVKTSYLQRNISELSEKINRISQSSKARAEAEWKKKVSTAEQHFKKLQSELLRM